MRSFVRGFVSSTISSGSTVLVCSFEGGSARMGAPGVMVLSTDIRFISAIIAKFQKLFLMNGEEMGHAWL